MRGVHVHTQPAAAARRAVWRVQYIHAINNNNNNNNVVDKQLVVRCITKLVLSHNKTVWAFLSINREPLLTSV